MSTQQRSRKQFVIYDGRAKGGDPDDAVVYCCAATLAEARKDVRESFPDGAIYEYDVLIKDGETDELINERFVE
jgi:hypothetical protein